jgi:hypothetical protein
MTSPTKELYLSVIDQTICRQYCRHLLIFPLPNSSLANDALWQLRTGLPLTIQQLPFLAGTLLVPDVSTGIMQATYPDPVQPDCGDISLIASHDFAKNPEFAYETMEAEGFPAAMLPAYAFCPTSLRNHPGLDDPYAQTSAKATKGIAVPVMGAQATLIPGGMVLSVYIHHSVMDGVGFDKLYELWGTHVRNFQDGKHSSPPQDCSSPRRALDAMIPLSHYTPLPTALNSAPPPPNPPPILSASPPTPSFRESSFSQP